MNCAVSNTTDVLSISKLFYSFSRKFGPMWFRGRGSSSKGTRLIWVNFEGFWNSYAPWQAVYNDIDDTQESNIYRA